MQCVHSSSPSWELGAILGPKCEHLLGEFWYIAAITCEGACSGKVGSKLLLQARNEGLCTTKGGIF